MRTTRSLLIITTLTALLTACSSPTEERAPVLILDAPATNNATNNTTNTTTPAPLPVTPVEDYPTLVDINPDPDIVEVTLTAEVQWKTLGEDVAMDMFTYNGTFPGPLLEAKAGDRVIVHFTNHLPEPTTIHWHGLRIPDDMDGNPRIQAPVEPGASFTYDFVVPDEGTFWYHPHVRTHEQIERGLYGMLIVREPEAVRPLHARERLFTLDDILLQDGKLASFWRGGHPELMHGRTGNTLLTNGRIDGVRGQAVAGERERWRLVNTSNARTMTITIEGARFVVYGNDGGRIEPYQTPRLVLPVGQRFDVEVIYDTPGQVVMQQRVLVLDAQDNVVEQPFDVATITVAAAPEGSTPMSSPWPEAPALPDRPVDREEELVFDAVQGGEHGVMWRINGKAHAMEPLFEFKRGEVVKMTLRNTLGPEHPFHLHGQFFTIKGKPGLWDTALIPGQSTVELTAFMDNPGEWMLHCHIAEHAELGMMTSFVVKE